jgi:hypothetical protein
MVATDGLAGFTPTYGPKREMLVAPAEISLKEVMEYWEGRGDGCICLITGFGNAF